MIKTVYIDVLFCVNLIINYCILLAVSKYSKVVPKHFRIILGSLFGAACSIIIFLPEFNVFLNLIIKVVIAAVIVFITFGRQNLKLFIKKVATFFFISFCFCGLMIAIWFIFTPKNMTIHNSVVYFNISPIIMIISSVVCYFILRFFSKLSGRETPNLEVCKIKIINNGKYSEIYGKVDTGNTLVEPFSNAPVIVADRKSINSVLPQSVIACLHNYNLKDVDSDETESIRFIPFNSVGGNGLLPSFEPEELYINNEIYHGKAYIAVCKDGRINGSCKAMVNPQITMN